MEAEMDYFETLRAKADERCKSLFKIVSDLKQQIPRVEKRLQAEKGNRDSLQHRLAKLDELSMESLSEQNAYEKYKASMRKLKTDLAVSEEIVANISGHVLPNAETRKKDSETNLGIVLRQIVLEVCKGADAAINELLRQCLSEREAFLDAGQQLFRDYGLTFVINDEAYCPSPWKAEEINTMRIGLGMTANPEPSREEVFRNYTSAVESPHKPEGILIPPEPVSQAVAAPGAVPAPAEVEPPDSIEPEQIGPDAEHEPVEPIADEPPIADAPPVPAEPLNHETVWGDEEILQEADEKAIEGR